PVRRSRRDHRPVEPAGCHLAGHRRRRQAPGRRVAARRSPDGGEPMSLLLLALLACDSALSPVGDVPPDSERDPSLSFALSQGEGTAGEALGYTLRFEDTYGPVSAQIEVLTDKEPQLQTDDDALTPTV